MTASLVGLPVRLLDIQRNVPKGRPGAQWATSLNDAIGMTSYKSDNLEQFLGAGNVDRVPSASLPWSRTIQINEPSYMYPVEIIAETSIGRPNFQDWFSYGRVDVTSRNDKSFNGLLPGQGVMAVEQFSVLGLIEFRIVVSTLFPSSGWTSSIKTNTVPAGPVSASSLPTFGGPALNYYTIVQAVPSGPMGISLLRVSHTLEFRIQPWDFFVPIAQNVTQSFLGS